MNDVIQQTIYFIISYIGIVGVLYFALHWLSGGWITAWLKVKASRGKKVLVIAHGITDTYFRIGQFEGQAFKFKDRDGKGKILTNVASSDIIHFTGVSALTLDPISGTIINKGDNKPGNIPEEVDGFYNRIIQAPTLDDKFRKIVIGLLAAILIAAIIGVAISGYNYNFIKDLQTAGVII